MGSLLGTPQTTVALHPFNRPSADVILRSCDLVDFRVHRGILTESSPFFSDMFELPQPAHAEPTCATEAARAPPVVDMAGDAETLDALLRLLYPIVKPPLEDPKLLALVLKAAHKYDMAWPATVLSERLLTIAPQKVLQVWAATCRVRTGLEDVARQAAAVLRTSWTRTESEALSLMDDLEDMTGVSAGDYLRLKQFLHAAQADADSGHLTLLSPTPELALASSQPAISITPFSTTLPSPDVECQSCSERDPDMEWSFMAHSAILSLHSPVLRERLVLEQDALRSSRAGMKKSKGLKKGYVGVLTVTVPLLFDEDFNIVSLLLKACYGGEEGLPADLELATIAELFRASRKYEMTRVARWVRAAWDRAAARRPLEAYFVAINHGLDECVRAAAKNVLMGPVANACTTVMEDAPTLAYHRLLVYYDACYKVRKERFSAIGRQMPVEVRMCGLFSTASIVAIIDQASEGAHGVPPRGGPKDALSNTLISTMSAGDIGQDELWNFLHPLLKCVTAVPDEVAAAIDDVCNFNLFQLVSIL